MDCLDHHKPPVYSPANVPQQSPSQASKSLTDVFKTVARFFDEHQHENVQFLYDPSMILNLHRDLLKKTDPVACQRESPGVFLAKYARDESSVVDAANTEELHFEQDQAELLRLAAIRFSNDWISEEAHWRDGYKCQQKAKWMKVPSQGALVESDATCWRIQWIPEPNERMTMALDKKTICKIASFVEHREQWPWPTTLG
jgi:hypothetical protein